MVGTILQRAGQEDQWIQKSLVLLPSAAARVSLQAALPSPPGTHSPTSLQNRSLDALVFQQSPEKQKRN